MDGVSTIPILAITILILVFIVISIVMVYSYLKDKRLDDIRADVYQLFLKAEHMYKGSGTGKQKMKYVISKARLLLPPWLQALLSETALERLFETWFREVKDLLDDGKVNGSQKENGPGDSEANAEDDLK